MEKEAEIKFSLVLFISFFLHVILAIGIMLPVYDNFIKIKSVLEKPGTGRDIIVNINEDNKKIIDKTTLLSEKDSSAKGYITKEKGDHWLNNYRDFALKKGGKSGDILPGDSTSTDKTGILITDNTELIIRLIKQQVSSLLGRKGIDEFTRIPDKNSFQKDNSIFYSNDGTFSFNTLKFKPFHYFKEMKDKIASHWFPPLLANSVIVGFDSVTGSYTPGRLRIMAIPNQLVKLYFTMNREGDILDVGIVESMGNVPLDNSCLDAVRLSKTFGKVPEEVEGDVILIRFVFIYVVR